MGRAQRKIGSRWAVVAQLVTALGEQLSLEGLVGRTLDPALAVLAADATALYTIDVTGQRLDLVAERGLPPGLLPQIASLPLAAPTLTSKAAVMGESQLVADSAELPSDLAIARDLAQQHGFRSFAAVPLRAHGQLVGVITFATRRPRRFGQSDVEMIEVIAHALASGILNARGFEAERRMRVALEAADEATLAIAAEIESRRVLQAIVERARQLAKARYGALGIGTDPRKPFDPWVFSGVADEQARLIGPHPRPVGLLGAVLAGGQAIRVPDVSADPRFHGWPPHHPHVASFLGVPIRVGDETIGNLYLGDNIEPAGFSAEDERAVASLAAHAAVAYRHAQLYEQAQAQRNRLQAVVESSPLGIIFVEATSGYLYANRAAEQLLGRPIVPAGGRDQYLAQFRRPDGSALPSAELPSVRALRGEAVIGTELVLLRPDGSALSILANAEPIRDARGQITGAVVLWQDISPLKLEQLREEFISLVAHELRAPITVIAGYADLLSRRQQGEIERRATENIRVSVGRLERLVKDLLDASRIEARRLQLELRPVQMGALVQEIVERLREVIAGHPIRVTVEGNPPPVEADPERIEQVLTNLLTNAAKYSSPETEIRVAVVDQPAEVLVAIRDEGSGIPPEELPRLFTRFYRTSSARRGQAPGLGLGLYIARGLVEAHGGRIWVTTEPGRGATFHFALPALSTGAGAPAPPEVS